MSMVYTTVRRKSNQFLFTSSVNNLSICFMKLVMIDTEINERMISEIELLLLSK